MPEGSYKMPQDLLAKAKYEEQQLTKERCQKRIKCITEIVNQQLCNVSNHSCFKINDFNKI